jgi:hypothetical protein
MAVEYIGKGAPDGTSLGSSSSEKISFYGVTPVVQPASAVQASVSGFTSASFATSAGFAAMIAMIENMRASLVALGLLKGGA